MRALAEPGSSTSAKVEEQDSSSEDEEYVTENDADRRKTLLASEEDHDQISLGPSWQDFESDFIFTGEGGTEEVDEEIPPTSPIKQPGIVDEKRPLKKQPLESMF